MSPHRTHPQYGRRLFIAATCIAAAYLFVVVRSCTREAQMSLEGASAISDTSISTYIINRRPYQPPPDSTLTVGQIQFELDVLQALDTVDHDTKRVDALVADIFNRHVASTSEYDWIRSTSVLAIRQSIGSEEWKELNVTPAQRQRLIRYADTVHLPDMAEDVIQRNQQQIRMFLHAFVTHGAVLAEERDQEVRASLSPRQ